MPDLESRGWNYIEERFGVERGELKNYELRKRSGDLWLVSRDLETSLNIEAHGIRFIRDTNIGLKPTTYSLQFLGDRIEKNRVEMSREETLKMLKREEMIERNLEKEGYVALEFEDCIVGCGFYRNGKVSSRIPKSRSQELEEILSV